MTPEEEEKLREELKKEAEKDEPSPEALRSIRAKITQKEGKKDPGKHRKK